MAWARFLLLGLLSLQGFFEAGGVRLHYYEGGRGEPVLLLHGWAVDARMWTPLARALTPEFRVLALDLRGHGLSDKPHDPEAYGPEMAKDALRLLDHLGLPKVHLVGYSLGAVLAGWLVAEHPERFLSVVFAGGAPVLDWDPRDIAEQDAFLGRFWETPWLRLAAPLLGLGDPEALGLAYRSLRTVRADRERLRAYGGPVLFLYGSRDWPSTLRYVEAARPLLPQAEVRVLPGADHLSAPSHPAFAQAILDFLRRARSAPP